MNSLFLFAHETGGFHEEATNGGAPKILQIIVVGVALLALAILIRDFWPEDKK